MAFEITSKSRKLDFRKVEIMRIQSTARRTKEIQEFFFLYRRKQKPEIA